MSYKIIPLRRFQKDVKNLKKRFPKIKEDIIHLSDKLIQNPASGTPLGSDLYKMRIANSSVKSGKSGGFCVITYLKLEETIVLVTIYSKSDRDSISVEQLQEIIQLEGL